LRHFSLRAVDFYVIYIQPLHVTWVPLTTAWRVLGLLMEMASRYGG